MTTSPNHFDGSRALRVAASIAVALLLLGRPGVARAETRASGSQMTPDSRGYLINKDLGNG